MRTIDAILVASLAGSALGGCSHHADSIGLKLVQPANIAANDQIGEVVDQGRHYLDDRNFALAISQFREALRLDPEHAAAHNGLAIAYTSIGRPDLARRHFELAVAYGPADSTYQRNYAHFLGGEQAGAEAALAQASTRANADERRDLPAVAAQATPAGLVADGRANSQGPMLVDGSGVAMLLSRPQPTSNLSARSKTAGATARPGTSYNLAAFGLAPTQTAMQPMLRRTSLFEVRLVTVAASLRGPRTAGLSDAPAIIAKFSASLAEASFWGAVDRSRARAGGAVHSTRADNGCAGTSRYVPRWSGQLTVQIRQCSA